ncbi:unnamed protein product, partial [Allacma fusca]
LGLVVTGGQGVASS